MFSLQLYHLLTWSTRKNSQICGLSDRSHLGFFGHSRADCPFCCTCFWQSRIGIDRYPGFLQEVRAGFGRRPGTVRVRVESGQEFWVSWCWTQCFPRGLGQSPVLSPKSRPMVPGRELLLNTAIAGKVKVVGAWVHTAELKKSGSIPPLCKSDQHLEKERKRRQKSKGPRRPNKNF